MKGYLGSRPRSRADAFGGLIMARFGLLHVALSYGVDPYCGSTGPPYNLLLSGGSKFFCVTLVALAWHAFEL